MDENLDVIDGQQQKLRIYQGLKKIGNQIAAFYLDGVRIYHCNDFQSKTNLLGHLAREIEGGLTDVMNTVKNENKINITQEISKSLKVLQKAKLVDNVNTISLMAELESILQGALQSEKQQGGHRNSILNALDASADDELAREWLGFVKKLHQIAHRSKVWENPKDPKIGEQLWDDFETTLEKLVGTYSRMYDRVDRLVKYEAPTEKLVTSITGILSSKVLRDYFFMKLRSPKWVAFLMQAGYFELRDDISPYEVPGSPGSYIIPNWYELGYIHRLMTNNEKVDTETTRLVSEIISNIVSQNSGTSRIDNHHIDGQLAQLIGLLPEEFIKNEMIKYLGIALKSQWDNSSVSAAIATSVLPHLVELQQKEMVLTLLEKALCYQGNGYFRKTIMNDYWLSQFLTKHDEDLGMLCGKEVIVICLTKIRELIAIDKYNYYFNSFTDEDIKKLHADNFDDILLIILRQMIKCINNVDVSELVHELSLEIHPFFRHLRIYLIGKHFESQSEVFWNLIKGPIDEETEEELLELLERNCAIFNESEQNDVLNWIEISTFQVPNQYAEVEQKIQQYRKLKYLNALQRTNNSRILELAKQYKEQTQDLIGNQRSNFLPSKADMLGKTNVEIVYFIERQYNGKTIDPEDESTLKKLFMEVAGENPAQISANMQPFCSLPWCYQYSLIQLFAMDQNDNGHVNYIEILDFFHSIIIDDDKFWNNVGTKNHDSRRLAIGNIIYILERYVDDGILSQHSELLDIFERILTVLTEKNFSSARQEDNHGDMLLGNHLGRAYSIVIKYLFFLRKTGESKAHKNWARSLLTERANLKPSPELFAVIGAYLKELVKREYNLVREICIYFPNQDALYFAAASTNYLLHYRYPAKALYLKLKDIGYYERMINLDVSYEVNKALVFHLVIGFFQGWESKESDILLERLVDAKKPKQLIEVLRNLSVKSNIVLSADAQSNIKKIWKRVFDQVKNKDNDTEFEQVLSSLVLPITSITLVDTDILLILDMAVKHPKAKYQYYIDFCANYVEVRPEHVGKLFLAMLNSDYIPWYEEEGIKKVVDTLFEKGEKETAIAICDVYVKQGHDFLREIEKRHV